MFFATISVLCFCPIDHFGVEINQWKIPSVDTKYREEERKPEEILVLTSGKYFFSSLRKMPFLRLGNTFPDSRKSLFFLKEILFSASRKYVFPASGKYFSCLKEIRFPASGGRTENICVFVLDKDLSALQQGTPV